MNRDELIEEIKKEILAQLQDYKERAEAHFPEDACKMAKDAQDTSRKFIKENPLLCVVLALGVGLAIGRLLYREEEK